jgi:hypothetical protein
MYTLTLEQLRAAKDAGDIVGVSLKSEGGTFFIQVDTQSGGVAVLAKARTSEPRSFGNPVQALNLLRKLGLFAGTFDIALWQPEQKGVGKRPDRSVALKRTHEAAEYDKWFRRQVQPGLAEANDSNTAWVPHKTVKESIERQRKALQSRIKSKA